MIVWTNELQPPATISKWTTSEKTTTLRLASKTFSQSIERYSISSHQFPNPIYTRIAEIPESKAVSFHKCASHLEREAYLRSHRPLGNITSGGSEETNQRIRPVESDYFELVANPDQCLDFHCSDPSFTRELKRKP